MMKEELKEEENNNNKPKAKLGTFEAAVFDYIDDEELYKPRYDHAAREKYWEYLLDHPRVPPLPDDFIPWNQNKMELNEIEEHSYPLYLRVLLKIISSRKWDYAYLWCFALFVLVTIAYFDGFIEDYFTVTFEMVQLPLALMFIVQLIPTLSAIYFITRCNDMVKFYARRNFDFWAFNVVLIMQYIEYTYYTGHYRGHKAGSAKPSPNPLWRRILRRPKIIPITEAPPVIESESSEEEIYQEDLSSIHQDEESSIATGGTMETGIEGGGYMQRLAAERAKREAEEKQAKIDAILAKEAEVVDWLEWKCVTCGLANRRPRHPLEREFVVAFSTVGVHYKRTKATLIQDPDMPRCKRCFTLANYEPRLCTAHLFDYYPKKYKAFENYPEALPTLRRHFLLRFFDTFVSCCFGQRNHPDSKLLVNDWRLSMYLSSKFPIVPRPIKPPDELYQVGEVIECRLQKIDWSRARITVARVSKLYDIKYVLILFPPLFILICCRYDTGDEVRMVPEVQLRLPPGKGAYAYRVELWIALLVLFFPIGVLAAITISPALFVFPLLVLSIVLLYLRVVAFVEYFREYYTAGCLVIAKQSALFTVPILLLLISSLITLGQESLQMPWSVCAVLFIVTMFSALPVIYFKRPTFAVMFLILSVQVGAFLLLAALRLDGTPIDPFIATTLAPVVTSIYTLLKYRKLLGFVWDVSLIIRPLKYDQYEMSSPAQLWHYIHELFKSDTDSIKPTTVVVKPTPPAPSSTSNNAATVPSELQA